MTFKRERIKDFHGKLLTFLIIMTRKGSFMANVFFGSAGHCMNVVLTLVPIISNTEDWISGSVILLMCPFRTVEINNIRF
jgi:hypothetical protein